MALSRSDLAGTRFDTEGLRERCTLVGPSSTALGPVLAEHRPRTVFHLAAQTQVGEANRAPLATWETNVRGTYCCSRRCASTIRQTRVVVASSDKAYGSHDELPYREDLALQPSYPYDVSKAATDLIARSYARRTGMPVAVTRLANVYGPGDVNWSRVIPDTARALVRGERPVIRSDGTPERDYLYVEDAADAYLAVAASLDDPRTTAAPGTPARASPVRAGGGRRLIEVAGVVVRAGHPGRGVPHGEIDRQCLDSTAIREELGWTPRWDLDAGLHWRRGSGTGPHRWGNHPRARVPGLRWNGSRRSARS